MRELTLALNLRARVCPRCGSRLTATKAPSPRSLDDSRWKGCSRWPACAFGVSMDQDFEDMRRLLFIHDVGRQRLDVHGLAGLRR